MIHNKDQTFCLQIKLFDCLAKLVTLARGGVTKKRGASFDTPQMATSNHSNQNGMSSSMSSNPDATGFCSARGLLSPSDLLDSISIFSPMIFVV